MAARCRRVPHEILTIFPQFSRRGNPGAHASGAVRSDGDALAVALAGPCNLQRHRTRSFRISVSRPRPPPGRSGPSAKNERSNDARPIIRTSESSPTDPPPPPQPPQRSLEAPGSPPSASTASKSSPITLTWVAKGLTNCHCNASSALASPVRRAVGARRLPWTVRPWLRAVARAFAAPLLDFRRSKGFDRLLLQRIYLRGEDKDVGLLYGVPRTVRWAPWVSQRAGKAVK